MRKDSVEMRWDEKGFGWDEMRREGIRLEKKRWEFGWEKTKEGFDGWGKDEKWR